MASETGTPKTPAKDDAQEKADKLETLSSEDAILRVLAGRNKTDAELSTEVAIEKDELIPILDEMVEDGDIYKGPDYVYALTIQGHKYLDEKGWANVSDTLGNRENRDDNEFNAASDLPRNDKGETLPVPDGQYDPTEPNSVRDEREFAEADRSDETDEEKKHRETESKRVNEQEVKEIKAAQAVAEKELQAVEHEDKLRAQLSEAEVESGQKKEHVAAGIGDKAKEAQKKDAPKAAVKALKTALDDK